MAMAATDEATTMPGLRQRHHPGCVVCSPDCGHGLQVHFYLDKQGAAVGSFDCGARYEGYPGLLHGGVISALLDGAMTNCLFLHGRATVTAELVVRFRHPVVLGKPARLRAWIAQSNPPVFRLRAELVHDGIVKAGARAAFMLPKALPRRVEGVQA